MKLVTEVGSEVDLHGASDLCILTSPELFKPFYAASFSENGPVWERSSLIGEQRASRRQESLRESLACLVILHSKGVIKLHYSG
jgi:hypothetical protein